MGDDETTATTLVGKIRLNGALAGKEEPLHSWVPRSNPRGSNHELDEQATATSPTSFPVSSPSRPTAVYSNFVNSPRSIPVVNVIVDEM